MPARPAALLISEHRLRAAKRHSGREKVRRLPRALRLAALLSGEEQSRAADGCSVEEEQVVAGTNARRRRGRPGSRCCLSRSIGFARSGGAGHFRALSGASLSGGRKKSGAPDLAPPRGLLEREGARRRRVLENLYMYGIVGSEFSAVDATVVDERAGGCRRVHSSHVVRGRGHGAAWMISRSKELFGATAATCPPVTCYSTVSKEKWPTELVGCEQKRICG